jgi:hypothetical protein
MTVLLCQVSTKLIDQGIEDLADKYYKRLWEVSQEQGFVRPEHFWEIPPWIALIRHGIKDAEFKTVTNIDEFVDYINSKNYNYICFSVMEANKVIIRNIIDHYTGSATFAVGGYIELDSYFAGYDNVAVFNTINDFVQLLTGTYSPGYNYVDFSGYCCIPRLTLSTGCNHRCRFCTEGGNPVIEKPEEEIEQQIKAFEDLKFSLIYLNDKTFGQAKNHQQLEKFYKLAKSINNKFKGFIVQTTPSQFLKLSDDYITNSQILYVELGVETFNDPILRKHHKPSSTSIILESSSRFRKLSTKLIPNIIVGMPEETAETYRNTLNYLEHHLDVIQHLNLCHLAIYNNTELGRDTKTSRHEDHCELIVDKSFYSDPQCHRWFHERVFRLGLDILDRD